MSTISECAAAGTRVVPIIFRRCRTSMPNCSARRLSGWRTVKATTMSHEFRPGEVITYPYLWAWQQQRGETEGRNSAQSVSSSPSAVRAMETRISSFWQSPHSRRRWEGLRWKFPISNAGAPVSVISNRVGSSSTNTITISSSDPGTSSLIRRFLAASASRSR